MVERLYILRIEIDGHFHGSGQNVPRPWAARIDGPDEVYGLSRSFVKPMNDWRHARRAWSGNLYGVVSTFALREGALYEISRCRGRSSRRYVAREFVWVEGGKMHERSEMDALAHITRDDERPIVRVELDDERRQRLAEVRGLGRPEPLGWVVRGTRRVFCAREGAVYEVSERDGARRLALMTDGRLRDVSEEEAIAWLRERESA